MQHLEDLFRDLMVVEFASALAGPLAGTFLKELGAKVIKIEPPIGDVSRRWRLQNESADKKTSFYYCAANGNKASRVLDLKAQDSKSELQGLIKSADVIITNFTWDRAKTFGLTYDDLKEINPRIILANITGFGPQADKPAFDVLMQAECGFMAMTGFENQSPTRIPLPIIDILSGHQLKQAILCALLRLAKTGLGTEVQVSLFDSALSALTNVGSNYLMGNVKTKPCGSKHPSIAPYGDTYITKDGQTLILAIGSDAQFERFCEAIKLPELTDQFITNRERVMNRSDLNDILQRKFSEADSSYWVTLFGRSNVPGGLVKSVDEVLNDKAAQKNILEETLTDGSISRRTRQAVFI